MNADPPLQPMACEKCILRSLGRTILTCLWRSGVVVVALCREVAFAGGETNREGVAHDSLICNGCVISGGRVERSILSPDVRTNSYSLVEDSILFHRVEIGRYAKIRRAIIDKDVKIPPGFSVGYSREQDSKRFTVTDSGVVVIGKGERISTA